MDTLRTVQCLGTLATSTRLAQLVRSYYLVESTGFDDSRSLSEVIAVALENMIGLTELFLCLGPNFSSEVLRRATFKLQGLTCMITQPHSEHSIARFLNHQRTIESLYLVCHPESLSSLSPDALPALKGITAPLRLLPYIVPINLSHITHISVLGTIADPNNLGELAMIFESAPTPPVTPIECMLGLDFRGPAMHVENVSRGLSLLGQIAPWIRSLRLEVHQGQVERDFLCTHLTTALSFYPALQNLAIISSQSRILTSTRPNPILYDAAQHTVFLDLWSKHCPTLTYVMFPTELYTYIELPASEGETGESGVGEDVASWVGVSVERFNSKIEPGLLSFMLKFPK